MPAANVASQWIDGDLYFRQKYSGTVGSVRFAVPIYTADTFALLSNTSLGLTGSYTLDGFNALPSRYELRWAAGQRGKPGANGDITSATEATRMIADPSFEVLGTNASSDDVTYYAEGGITIETDGANNDQVIIAPHLTANISPWTGVTWGTDKQTKWEAVIRTNAITAATIWAGLKLTNTSVTATDDNQAFFRYAAGTNGGKWQAVSSVSGTDDAADAGVTVAADTVYRLTIVIDSARKASFYINNVLVKTSDALADAIDLIPYIGVQANGSAAKSINVIGQAISRVVG